MGNHASTERIRLTAGKKKGKTVRRGICPTRDLRGASRDGCGLGAMIIMSQRRRRDCRKSEVGETRTDARATFSGSCPRPISAGKVRVVGGRYDNVYFIGVSLGLVIGKR